LELFKSKIIANVRINHNTFLLQLFIGNQKFELISGQFFNIKVSNGNYPFLRRPISICDFTNGLISFIISIDGKGTELLSLKKAGEELNLLGPLGNGFDLVGDYENAIIIGGGIGIAPFPYLTRQIGKDKNLITFVGGKTSNDIITYNLENIIKSTDDGSEGFKGNVVDCLKYYLQNNSLANCRIFACGPTVMLKALQKYTNDNSIDCQISTESSMACGFGLCQGCAVEKSSKTEYALVCKDGPVFNSNEVVL